MPARLTAYLPDAALPGCLLAAGDALRIGRGADCGLRIEHPSVSRHHADLVPDGDGWLLRDAGSKNGSFVDGRRAEVEPLAQLAWLRIGDIYCEFEWLDPSALVRENARRRTLVARSTQLTRGLCGADCDQDVPLRSILDGVVELSGCRRGMLLLADDGETSVYVTHGTTAGDSPETAFAGSRGVLDRCLAERRPVVVNDVARAGWLARRASIVASPLRRAVCLPLMDGGTLLGAVYADADADATGDRPVAPLTELELELLGEFAERAAVRLAAGRLAARLGDPAPRRAPPRTRSDE